VPSGVFHRPGHRPWLALIYFDVVVVGVGDVECRMVVRQGVLSFGEAFGVVEAGHVWTPGLMHRAQKSLAAFFGDAGDPNRVRDDRPGVVGLAGGAGTHHVERR
jgi:hypothetical protein